jgi:predicted glycosyltransferase
VSRRPRVLFLPVDGPRGLGHLSRTCKLAHGVRDVADCLIATGLRDTCGLIPENCEYVRVPGLSGLPDFPEAKNSYPHTWRELAPDIREELFLVLERTFNPDVIVTDLFPIGWNREWAALLAQSKAKKCIVFRPVPGANTVVRVDEDGGLDNLHALYDAIFIAGDERAASVYEDLKFSDREISRSRHIGYVSLRVSDEEIVNERYRRGLKPGDVWVVCSAGSGLWRTDLLNDFLRLATSFPDVYFDVISGPFAPQKDHQNRPPGSSRMRLIAERADLRIAHAAADVVICHGGYNTMAEAMEGGATLIVDPGYNWTGERHRHALLLRQYYPITIAEDATDLTNQLGILLNNGIKREPIRTTTALDFNGCETFANLVST